MAKIAVISDIHGNMHALELFIQDANKRGINEIICLGDFVSKYLNNAEVVEEILKMKLLKSVKGNLEYFIKEAPEAFPYVIRSLRSNQVRYLTNLPEREQLLISGTIIDFFHASPHNIEAIFNPFIEPAIQNPRYKKLGLIEENVNNMLIFNETAQKISRRRISLCGHTHQQYMGIVNESRLQLTITPELIIKPNMEAIINVGSIGDPSYTVVDNGKLEFYVDHYISYVVLEGELNSTKESDIRVEVIKIPYKETLKKVYMDMRNVKRTWEEKQNVGDVFSNNQATKEFTEISGITKFNYQRIHESIERESEATKLNK